MNTLFDKIWDKHVVQTVEDGPTQLYIDRLYCHEGTTPQAFDTLRDKLGVYVLPITKNTRRYFVFARTPKDPLKGVPYYYLMAAHAKRNPKIKVPRNSLIESYALYGYTVCLDDGNLLQ